MKYAYLVLSALLLLAACHNPQPSTVQPVDKPVPTSPSNTLGQLEITINGIGDTISSSAQFHSYGLQGQKLSNEAGFSADNFQELSVITFTAEGKRHITASYGFSNPNNRDYRNLTFVAKDTSSTEGTSPFKGVQRFDGTAITGAALTPFDLQLSQHHIYNHEQRKATVDTVHNHYVEGLDISDIQVGNDETLLTEGFRATSARVANSFDIPQSDNDNTTLEGQVNFSSVFSSQSPQDDPFSFTLVFEVSQDPTITSQFNIAFDFGPNISEAQKVLFNQAARRWESVITGDLPDIDNVSIAKDACGTPHAAFTGAVDDVVIFADVRPVDGPNNVLASAGPCQLRARPSLLTIYGVMIFDSADSNTSDLFETILHEMGHVLGIGTLWTFKSLVNYDNSNCPATPLFTATNAVREYQSLGATGNVPVEQDGGRGTACGHWDEETFDTELMTGISEGPSAEPLSRMTIASLEDLGYQVDYNVADAYSLPTRRAIQSQARDLARGDLARGEVLIHPRWLVHPDGTTTTLRH